MLVILRVCPWSASFLTSHSILRCCQLVERRKREMVCQPSRLKGRSWAEKSLPAFPCSRVHSTTTTHALPHTHIFCVYIHTFHFKEMSKEGCMFSQNSVLRSVITSIKFSSIVEQRLVFTKGIFFGDPWHNPHTFLYTEAMMVVRTFMPSIKHS